jgi:carbamoyl-phosphate synthase large subunit
MGGQIPNNLAMKLHRRQVPVIGTSPADIDRAEDRDKFSSLLDRLGVDQPRWARLSTTEEIHRFIGTVGYPVLIRPSYVLSGAAMNVVSNDEQLDHFLKMASDVSKEHPVVVSEFIEQAKEIEMDAVADHGEIIAYAISEHVEFAGVHSGDATIVFPPQKLYVETIRRIKRITRQIAVSLQITGPFNIQFLARDNDIKVIECNLRASRSFPFVSKVMKLNLIDIAIRVMLGLKVEKPDKSLFELDYVGVKAPQFSFARLLNADPVLGVDMASTGEVGCIGENYYEAILKAMLSVGYTIPAKNILISSGPSRSKVELLESARMLRDRGYQLYATEGTHKYFMENGVENSLLHWPDEEDRHPNTVEFLREKKIDLVINIPKNYTKRELRNGYQIRRSAIDYNIPLITNSRVASAFVYAICKYAPENLTIKSWGEY